MIIIYLTYDTRSLRACTMTCYSWYIAAVPHLYHTLITTTRSLREDKESMSPKPLLYRHKLGLLPLVKVFWLREGSSTSVVLPQKLFNRGTLHQFSALTNVQKLRIDDLDIPSFMPGIRRYFGNFLPSVLSLSLMEPKGSRRQILYFIGLFEHLENLQLLYCLGYQKEPADDLTLIPPFIPPLRGWLTLILFTRVGLLEDMIELFGGIRFRHMCLYNVDGMRLLLDACTKTLESVALCPHDGEQIPLRGVQALANDLAAIDHPLPDFDLSRHESLRTLEIPSSSLNHYPLTDGSLDAISFLKHVLSTITSSVFFGIVVFYSDYNLYGVKLTELDWPHLCELTQDGRMRVASLHREQFEVLREVYKVRKFHLELRASVWSFLGESLVQI
jgi:hypothetical protein